MLFFVKLLVWVRSPYRSLLNKKQVNQKKKNLDLLFQTESDFFLLRSKKATATSQTTKRNIYDMFFFQTECSNGEKKNGFLIVFLTSSEHQATH
jgi:hypothetical protein